MIDTESDLQLADLTGFEFRHLLEDEGVRIDGYTKNFAVERLKLQVVVDDQRTIQQTVLQWLTEAELGWLP